MILVDGRIVEDLLSCRLQIALIFTVIIAFQIPLTQLFSPTDLSDLTNALDLSVMVQNSEAFREYWIWCPTDTITKMCDH